MFIRINELSLFDGNGNRISPQLDPNATILHLDSCTSLTNLEEEITLPQNLESLITLNCINITNLPENLPNTLQSLEILNCPHLTNLPNLPDGLTTLKLIQCDELTHLPEIPDSITTLHLLCENLNITPELSQKIRQLEADGFDVKLSDNVRSMLDSIDSTHEGHLKLENDTLEDLNSVFEEYKKINPDLPTPNAFQTLLKRFATENIEERGGCEEISEQISEILNAFLEEPNHLKWADEIAQTFLAGCVNQPVAGWSEICALMAIAQAPKEEKIDSSKQYIVLKEVSMYLHEKRIMDDCPAVEVEAANLLFTEVHKKLLAEGDIAKPWLGVSKEVAYAGIIMDKIGGEIIEDFYSKTKQILDQDSAQVAESLLEYLTAETWASVAFPKELDEIKKHYLTQKFLIEDIINGEELEFDSAYEEFVTLAKSKNKSELLEMRKSLKNDEIREIDKKVEELIMALVSPIKEVAAEEVQHPETATTPQQIPTAAVGIDASAAELSGVTSVTAAKLQITRARSKSYP